MRDGGGRRGGGGDEAVQCVVQKTACHGRRSVGEQVSGKVVLVMVMMTTNSAAHSIGAAGTAGAADGAGSVQ